MWNICLGKKGGDDDGTVWEKWCCAAKDLRSRYKHTDKQTDTREFLYYSKVVLLV